MSRDNHCGRLDQHAAHEWIGRDRYPATPAVVRECPGAPVIEGGNPAAQKELERQRADEYEARYGRGN